MKKFLSIPEEVFLLTIDESSGQPLNHKDRAFDIVLASSILMDLALQRKIDTDLDFLIVDDKEDAGDAVLDEIFSIIRDFEGQENISYWISQIYKKADTIKEKIIFSLLKKQVVKVDNQKVLWMFSSKKYPIVDNQEIKEVSGRVRELVFDDEIIPDFRDIVIISLLNYSGMLGLIFTDHEAAEFSTRIETISKMDLIGQAIGKSLQEFTVAMKAKIALGIKTPEQLSEDLVADMKEKFNLSDEKLPDWLRKGSAQYRKTLKFVEQVGTNEIVYNKHKDKYEIKQFSMSGHVFGSGQ